MKTVFITRPLPTTDPFRKTLEAVGCCVLGQSLVEFRAVAFGALPAADWLFFYSKNAVCFFLQNIDNQSVINFKIGTIGESTAAYWTQQTGRVADFIGTGDPKTTAETFKPVAAGQRVLFPRAVNSQLSIQKRLSNDLPTLDLIVYDNQKIQNPTLPPADILVFTSPLNAEVYFENANLQPHQTVVAIGQTTAKALRMLGLESIVTATKPDGMSLAAAVLSCL